MSRKLATTIKDSAIPGKYKRVLEAYAAFANNDGTNIRPSQRQLGNKAGTSPDTVQRNTPDLLASGVLRRATSHTCKQPHCNKGTTHYAGTQGKWTQVYEIEINNLQNAVNYLAAICGKVNAAKCRKVNAAKCGTTQALKDNSAPLGMESNSSALRAVMNEGMNEEAPFAPLTAPVAPEQEKEKPGELVSEDKPTPHSTEAQALMMKWLVLTGHGFEDKDWDAAEKLLDEYGSHDFVMEVMVNTVSERPKSAGIAWRDFWKFAEKFEWNRDECLAWQRKAKIKSNGNGHADKCKKCGDLHPLNLPCGLPKYRYESGQRDIFGKGSV